jgi:NAD(P)-dependent dehydrogenase (short-subunit alcohol dehydrogenase family)
MKDFGGKVAVVTGAASGIGRALADRFVDEGMRVVVADVEQEALDATERELTERTGDVLAVRTDVSSRNAVDELAAATLERFGVPHVLCNNAGVAGGGGGPVWKTTEKDWEWVMGVNLMGIVHGIQAFVPHMVESGQEGHVVNTSSIYGLATQGPIIYGVTKHGVVRLSEGLFSDLRAEGSPIGVSVLCPGLIATRIVSSVRNRPAHLRNEVDDGAGAAGAQFLELAEKRFMENGMPPAEVAGIVVDAIREERFYVLTHPDMKRLVEQRFDAILDGSAPPATTTPNRRTP